MVYNEENNLKIFCRIYTEGELSVKKKIIGALLLSAVMVCTNTVAYAAEFKDLKNHWSQKYVDDVVAKGIIKGYEDNTFRPSKPVTKIESIVMISNLFDDAVINDIYSKNKAKYQANMEKSKIPAWAQKYIVFGAEKKLFPEKSIPYFMNHTKGKDVQSLSFRQEYAMLLVNALGFNAEFAKTPSVNYTDASKIDSKALPYIEVLGRKGIIQTSGKFNPKEKVTRAEAAVMISKSYAFSPKGKGENTNPTPQSEMTYRGKLNSVYVNGNTVTINMTDINGIPKIFSNDISNIRVTVNGQVAGITDVKNGMDIVVTATGNKITALQVTGNGDSGTHNNNGEMGQIIGTVKSYGLNSIEVTEASSSVDKHFIISGNTKIMINGKEDQIKNINLGDNVTVVAVGDRAVQIIVAGANSQTAVGKIRDIGKDTISISNRSGEVSRYDVNSSTRIYRGKQRLDSLDRLYVGEKVSIKAAGFSAITIDVEESKIKLRSATVVGISLRNNKQSEIVVEDRDGQSYSLGTDTKTNVYVKNRLKSIEDIKLGYEVDVEAEDGYISEISTDGEYAFIRIQGKVVSVDYRNDVITVDTGSKEVKVMVVSDTEIRNSYNNMKRSIDNIYKGYDITVNGVSRAGGIDAERIIYYE